MRASGAEAAIRATGKRGLGRAALVLAASAALVGSVPAQAEVKVLRGGDQAAPAAPSAPPASVPQAPANPSLPAANAPNPKGMANPDGSFWIADPATDRRFECAVGALLASGQREIACTARPQPAQEPALGPAP